jgi:hypothetical protein
VRRLDDGRLLFSMPGTCPGWAFAAHRPPMIGEAIARAFTEAQVAAYARWRGVLYDGAEHLADGEALPSEAHPRGARHPREPEPEPEPVEEPRVRRRRSKHPHTYDPDEWVPLEDGGMLSPRGHRYGPHTAMVASVRSRLAG